MANDPHDNEIDAAARDWVLKLASSPNDAILAGRCAAWRRRDGRHEAAYQTAKRVWERIGHTSQAHSEDWRREAEHLQWAARRSVGGRLRSVPWKVALPTSIAACLAIAVLAPIALRGPQLQFATAKAQIHRVALADGSHIDVGADSRVAVHFDRTSRMVDLSQGEAFFEVAHDPSRPFTVVAGDAEIRVTGTKFDVKRIDGKVVVTVLEGRVEVRRHPIIAVLRETVPERVLTGGEVSQLADSNGFTAQARVSPDAAGAWRQGRLSYADTPLSDVVADANRYSVTPIRIASPYVGALRVTTSFRAEAIDQFISNLEQSLPVKSSRDADGAVVISARD